ncbi:hydrogen peroxide-inducible genes activator [Wenxinia marina]|uniref:Transcriptional regulator n=1 Tax=Wenxinia marina DSM 24838 TaxID=1123501 RepID=A0A0D0QCH6_9RHOB|nr:hydrogen peroxide-inducible genes activator [Wenxinia marina]KIQ70027.1 Transcriptional regulator [Wenxinia marina DSM 24838]GGL62955.1 LysR family transcriptional regulator [Wenxinia marina]
MASPTLKQLRYFDALAAQGHFGRAAELCAISQPALSMQIRELEEQFGTPLFERGARQVRLTRVGAELAPRVRDILRSVDELGDIARATRGRLEGRLNVGVIPTVAPYLLPALIGALRQSHAGLDVHVRETLTPRLIEELADGRIDTAIVALPVDEPTLAEVPLFTERFVLVRPAAEADAPVPGGEALAQMKLLLLEEGHCFRDQALAYCAAGASAPRDGLDGTSLSTLVQMVGAGLGVTLIPEMAIPVEARWPGVAVARLPSPEPARTIGMVWRRTSPLAAQFAGIAEVVRAAAEPA